MKKLLLICIWSLCVFGYATAQTLTGVVRDKLTKEPVVNADVYLKGTSIHTLTDPEGRFELTLREQLNVPLIIGHLSYVTQTFDKLSAIPAEILLDEKVAALSEVTVMGKVRYSQAKKMEVFRDHFLGRTPAGKASRILNEEAIELIYDSEKMELRATCSEPLLIENKYLGYDIKYELTSFVVSYSRDAMVDKWVQYTIYAGNAIYKDVAAQNIRIQRRRKDIYKFSPANFFRTLTYGDLTQSHWKLIKNSELYSPQNCFAVTDTFLLKKVRVLPAIEKYTGTYMKPVYGEVGIGDVEHAVYTLSTGLALRSSITFFTPELVVDGFGNVYPWDGIMYGGEMAKLRLGDELPQDYEP